jgi:hypothetical protein
MSRQASTAPRYDFQITSSDLPGAIFVSRAATLEFVHEALEFERELSAFEQDGCDSALWDTMSRLGYDRAEIAATTASPATRAGCAYMMAADMRGY